MTSRNQRITLRVALISLQWLALTIAVGSFVMRSDASYEELITPHLGALPLVGAAIVAGFLLGITVEPPRVAVVLTLLMCFGAVTFVGIMAYAPVADGELLRTAALDNFVIRRMFLLMMIISIAAVPASIIGNLVGGNLNPDQEIARHPEDAYHQGKTPWWEQRYGAESREQSV